MRRAEPVFARHSVIRRQARESIGTRSQTAISVFVPLIGRHHNSDCPDLRITPHIFTVIQTAREVSIINHVAHKVLLVASVQSFGPVETISTELGGFLAPMGYLPSNLEEFHDRHFLVRERLASSGC